MYKNWCGECAQHNIIPINIYWGKTDWHPKEQWLLKVWSVDRKAYREYALQDIQKFIK